MSTYAPSLHQSRRTITAEVAALNTQYPVHFEPELRDAGVAQIPDDVHRIFSIFGDQAEQHLTFSQRLRLARSIRAAMKSLRAINLERTKRRTSWKDPDTGRQSICAGEGYWIDPVEPPPSLENPVQIFGPASGGNYTRRAAKYKFGKPRGKESHAARTAG